MGQRPTILIQPEVPSDSTNFQHAVTETMQRPSENVDSSAERVNALERTAASEMPPITLVTTVPPSSRLWADRPLDESLDLHKYVLQHPELASADLQCLCQYI